MFPWIYLIFLLLPTPGLNDWDNVVHVYVPGSCCGSSSHRCEGNNSRDPHCMTLDDALQGLRQNSTVLYLHSGVHTLYNVSAVVGKNNIALVGLSDETSIVCEANSTLSFTDSTGILFKSLQLYGCGDVFITDNNNLTVDASLGIRMTRCEDIVLRNLLIQPLDRYCDAVCNCLSLYSDLPRNLSVVYGQPKYITVYVFDNCTSSLILWKNDLFTCFESLIESQQIVSFNSSKYQRCANLSHVASPDQQGYPLTIYQTLPIVDNMSLNTISLYVSSQWSMLENVLLYSAAVSPCLWPFMINENRQCSFIFEHWFCCYILSNEEQLEAQRNSSCGTCNQQSSHIKYKSSENCLSQGFDGQFYHGSSPLYYDCSGCPSFVANCKYFDHFNISNLSSIPFCASGRDGRLCGACEPSKGVPINQLSNCVDCSQYQIPGIVVFALVELIPVTIMVFIIIVFGININQGFVIAAVYFFQVTAVVYPGLTFNMFESYCGEFDNYHANDCNYHRYYHFIIPNTIFNWNFVAFLLRYPLCISSHMTPLQAVAFWYLIPMYPIVLVTILYTWIRLYDRGVSFVVKISRPFHKALARFWRTFNIKSSLFHSIASIYTLSFTQLTATSLQILHPTKWQAWNDTENSGIAFFNDATVNYFSWPHDVCAVIAVIILIVFILMPMLFIQLYPFQFFQQFLLCLRLKKAVLVSLGDVFTGPFKTLSEDTFEYRYFAGFYFLLRVIVLLLHFMPYRYGPAILFTQEGLFLTFSGMIMIFRPYKRNIHNFGDFFIIVFLAFVNILMLYIHVQITKITVFVFSLLLYVILFCIFILYPIVKGIQRILLKHQQRNELQTLQGECADFAAAAVNNLECDFADRIKNPENYKDEADT